MTTATATILFILAVVCIAEALALTELWGRVNLLENITHKGGKAK